MADSQTRFLPERRGIAPRMVPDRETPRRRTPRALALPVALLLLWEAAGRAGLLAPNQLPAPSVVLAELARLAATGEIFEHIGITVCRMLLGFGLGAAAATVLGALTAGSQGYREFLHPLVQSLRRVPAVAWVPLLILWFGIDAGSTVTLVAVGVFFPVYLSLVRGIRDIDRRLVEVGRVCRLSGWQLVRGLLLPATLPSYLAGLRGGLALGWVLVVAAEMLGAGNGLGHLLIEGRMSRQAQVIIGGIILLGLLAKLSDWALVGIGRRFVGWQDPLNATAGGDGDAPDRAAL